MLASIRALSRPGLTTAELAKAKVQARELYDRVARALNLPEQAHAPVNSHTTTLSLTRSQRKLAEDIHMHVEIAKLWYEDDTPRVERALNEAFQLSEADGTVDPRLINNIGALAHLSKRYDVARTMYERALTDATTQSTPNNEKASTSILYNLARVYEDQGEDSLAKDAYDKLLSRHPEYVDGMCRKLINDEHVDDSAPISQNSSSENASRCQSLKRGA